MSRLKDAIFGKSDEANNQRNGNSAQEADTTSSQQGETAESAQDRQGPKDDGSRMREQINRGTEEDARLGIGLGTAAGLGAILGKP
jgi:hypothetical protein